MSSPAARLLLGEAGDPGGTFALFGRVGRSPRVFAARDREGLLRQMQAAALNKMGITLASRLSAEDILDQSLQFTNFLAQEAAVKGRIY